MSPRPALQPKKLSCRHSRNRMTSASFRLLCTPGSHYKSRKYSYLFFLSSVLISWTGAAGILIHHSLIRLSHLLLLSFLNGISRVKTSTKANRIKYLGGIKAKTTAMMINNRATLSVAWKTSILFSQNKTTESILGWLSNIDILCPKCQHKSFHQDQWHVYMKSLQVWSQQQHSCSFKKNCQLYWVILAIS